MMRKLLSLTALWIAALPAYAGFYMAPTLTYHAFTLHSSQYESVGPRLMVGDSLAYSRDLRFDVSVFGSPTALTIHDDHENGVDIKSNRNYGAQLLIEHSVDAAFSIFIEGGVVRSYFNDLSDWSRGIFAGAGITIIATAPYTLRCAYDYVKYKDVGGLGHPRARVISASLIYGFG